MSAIKEFTATFDVWDGMSCEAVRQSMAKATAEACERFDLWRSTHRVTVLGVTQEKYTSMNADNGPFWFRLSVLYDEVAG